MRQLAHGDYDTETLDKLLTSQVERARNYKKKLSSVTKADDWLVLTSIAERVEERARARFQYQR